jgi:predicted transcriptional regulator
MRTLSFRVNDETAEQLRRLASEEEIPIAAVVRRALRSFVQQATRTTDSLARAREGTGRDQ